MPVEQNDYDEYSQLESGEAPPRSRSQELEQQPEPVEIPHTDLSAEALQGVLEGFVLREGTDYGDRIFTLEQKVAHVRAQLERREVHILFDPATESVTLSSMEDYKRARIPKK